MKKSILKFNNQLHGKVALPQSKSYVHRYLLAALANRAHMKIKISQNTFASQDVQATLNMLRVCNVIYKYQEFEEILIINAQNLQEPVDAIDCQESASTLRMGIFVLLFLFGKIELTGSMSLLARPLTFLEIFCKNHNVIFNHIYHPKTKKIIKLEFKGNIADVFTKPLVIDESESSQYISGLMICGSVNANLQKNYKLMLNSDLESRGYLDITNETLKNIGSGYDCHKEVDLKNGKKYMSWQIKEKKIETFPQEVKLYSPPLDASNQSFWDVANFFGAKIKLNNPDSIQPDSIIREWLEQDTRIIDFGLSPDLFPIMCIYAVCRQEQFTFLNFHRNRLKESDRVNAMISQLRELGANIHIDEQQIIINPSKMLQGGLVGGYNDHRIVMSFALYGIITKEKIEITTAQAVNKSYPNFWTDLEQLGGIIE